jgi:MoaA/NifB/PqqE/SkfB family radical SAM enzyme
VRFPTIEWQVAGACNYDCSYCIQSRRYRKGRIDERRLDAALAFFTALPGRWEIKMSGGEAFAHAAFLERIVPGLMEHSAHRLSVLTNFSATTRELMRFLARTRGRLGVFSASLHLEFTSLEEFARKAVWFSLQLDGDVRFVVNQVVLPGREEEALRCRRAIEARGLRWFPQLYKTKGGVADYADEAALAAVLDGLGERESNRAPSYRGRRCWAGAEYFTVDKDGWAWSCRTAKRHAEGRLGNIYAGDVRLQAGARSCAYAICPCSVPANRGMIEGVPATSTLAAGVTR